MDKTHNLYPIISALQREAGGGCSKIIKLSCIFDPAGNLIVRSELEVIRLLPKRGVKQLVEGLKK